jgi:hypothetical protein
MRCCLYTWIFTLLRPYCFIILFNLEPPARDPRGIVGALHAGLVDVALLTQE